MAVETKEGGVRVRGVGEAGALFKWFRRMSERALSRTWKRCDYDEIFWGDICGG